MDIHLPGPDIEWKREGVATAHYSWAFLIGAVPGFLQFGVFGAFLGWVPLVIAYIARLERYDSFEHAREQVIAVVSVLFCWVLWYLGPLMWLSGWSRDYFDPDADLEIEEHF